MSVTHDPVVETTSGRVRGAANRGVYVFKGIPYGGDTGRENRFLPPNPAQPWTGIREASAFGHQSPKVPIREMPAWAVGWGVDQTDGEDCLALNVWTPGPDDRRRPVMVWFHGGGFAQGSAASVVYDGTRLAERGDVVLVSVNHRLNIFGYLHLSTLGDGRFGQSENLGQLDLIAALCWVRDNIAAFGGDPANVTIFGESGGGGKVCAMLAMPAAKGLFQRAIVQSGPLQTVLTREQAGAVARSALAALDLTPAKIDQIQTVPAPALIDAIATAGAGAPLAFSPMMGGATLPRHPLSPDAPEVSADVPVMIGWNKDELTTLTPDERLFQLDWPDLPARLALFTGDGDPHGIIDAVRKLRPQARASDVFFLVASDRMFGQSSRRIAALKAAQGRAPAFFYQLEWESPVAGGRYRCGHALDLPLVFDNVALSRQFVGEDEEVAQGLADTMSQAWLNFARNGDPNGAGIPRWSPYDEAERRTMVFDQVSAEVSDPSSAQRAAVDAMPILPF